MLDINIEDVKNVLISCRPYLIFLGIVLVAAVIALIVCAVNKKLQKKTKYLVRTQAGIVVMLAVVITVNMIVTGPMYTLVSLAMGDGSISQESIDSSSEFGVKVAEEGIVLLKNDDNLLPMTDKKTLNVFGWASTNPCYGGSGSGGISDAYPTISLLDGLKDAGFETNEELSSFYTEYRADRPSVNMFAQDWTLPEPPVDQYTDELMQNAKDFSDTAVVVFARTGCENADLPTDFTKVTYTNNSEDYEDFGSDRHYLELSRSEENMLDMVCDNFDNVIVVYNGSSVFELGFAEKHEQIKSLIWCPGTGQTGFEALGEILAGEVNPSGKTTDILVKDLKETPSYNNFVVTPYDNMDEHGVTNAFNPEELKVPSFANYVEGIYAGYRFYETAAAEGFLNYEDAVSYPFGYGMSYTSFEQKMGDLNVDADGNITVEVTVTNTGSVAGKDVVELYYNPPYYNGGIEKSSVNLAAFDKTGLLEPGQSETVTLTFDTEDMASYDTYGTGYYVLEQGDYEISLRTDSHTVVDTKTYSVPEMVVYDENKKHNGDVEVADNKFEYAEGNVTYLSRENGFANYSEATAAPTDFELDGTIYGNGTYDPTAYDNADDEMPVTGADNGLEVFDLRGADYDDERWESLLDEITVDEMVNLIAFGGHQNAAVDSVGKIRILDTDGPAGVNSSTLGIFGTGYCSQIILAQTWNTDLAVEYAKAMGEEFSDYHVTGWYAPSMNMHRSAFGGRNFEYYSEDSLLSAEMAKGEVEGAVESGMYPFIKHFALNEQEINRNAFLTTWTTEQAMREIYLKPFEEAVKSYPDGKIAVMTSYNFIGTEWAGSCAPLLKDVLRGEWGFKGMVISDYFGNYGYMDADRAVRGGTDMMLGTAGNEAIMTDLSATSVIAMRNAVKNILYTTVNSSAYENYVPGTIPEWLQTIYVVDAVLAILWVLAEIAVILLYRRDKKKVPVITIEDKE